MTDDPHLAEVFRLPPMVAFRKPPNLKSKLVRAEAPQETKRHTPGMKRCRYDCLTCHYVKPGSTVAATAANYKMDIEAAKTAKLQTWYTALIVTSVRSNMWVRQEKQRFAQHRGYVRNKQLE